MCQDDVQRIETQCMVVIMTVLSLCTQAECGFQRQISAEGVEKRSKLAVEIAAAAGKLIEAATTATPAIAAAVAVAAAAAAVAAAAAATYYIGKSLYKRFTWTSEAKEREFKRQFVAHVTKKLRLIVDLTSANCSKQVEQ